MILYKNTKIEVHSLDGDTNNFNIVAGMLQGNTLDPYLFIICQDYVLRTAIDLMKENSFKLAKERSKRYPAQTITDSDYTDDITLLANLPARAESLLHNHERAAGGTDFHVNVNKTEYMGFNQRGDIPTLQSGSLKLVDMFTYLRSNVSSTENDINTRLATAWTAIDRLSVIYMKVRPNR